MEEGRISHRSCSKNFKMDKTQLNLEIVLCRSLVKKAKICIIRKILKQVKILRSCKNEKYKEKKLRKARRLVAEIHAIKTLSPDYVTKFALVTENYVFSGSTTKLKRKRNACAKLTKHRELMTRINAIRNKFVNWREQLPLLLNSVKKENVKVTNLPEIENAKVENASEKRTVKNNVNIPEQNEAEEKEEYFEVSGENDEYDEEDVKCNENENEDEYKDEKYEEYQANDDGISGIETSKRLFGEFNVECDINNTMEVQKPKINVSSPVLEISKRDCVKSELIAKVKKKTEWRNEDPIKKELGNFGKKEMKQFEDESFGDSSCEEDKMDDPFFIGKKIIVPKLLQNNNKKLPEEEKMKKTELNENMEQRFGLKKKRNVKDNSEKTMDDSRRKKIKKGLTAWKTEPLAEEDLHPSWKAKKMQTLKPFQGKKIIFD